MEAFLVRLLIGIGIIWLTQLLLAEFSIKEPARKVLFLIVLIVSVLYILLGSVLPGVRIG